MVNNNLSVTPGRMADTRPVWYTRTMIDQLKKRVKVSYSKDEDVIAMLDYVGKLEYRLAKERERVRNLSTRLEDIEKIGN